MELIEFLLIIYCTETQHSGNVARVTSSCSIRARHHELVTINTFGTSEEPTQGQLTMTSALVFTSLPAQRGPSKGDKFRHYYEHYSQ